MDIHTRYFSAELRFGAELKRSAKLHRAIDAIVEELGAAPFDAAAADEVRIE